MTRESRSDSEKSSGERSDPREGEASEESKKTAKASGQASGEAASSESESDDIPLNIVGHEGRERPGNSSSNAESEARMSTDDGGATLEAESGESVLEFTEAESSEATDARTANDGVLADGAPTDGALDEGVPGGGALEDGTGDTEEDEVEPVELLVQLAKNGEIDPWDIDIVAVTDKFLAALDDADLRTSGRALFYASVLLRMKSDELFAGDEPEEEELPPWEAPFADEGAMAADGDDGGDYPPGFDPVENLEAEMERRLERKHARGKPETLDELVRELRTAERDSWWKESRSYDTSDSPTGYGRGVQELNYHSGDDFRVDDEPTSDDVTHTAHEEDIEAVIDDVEAELETHYEQGRDEVLYAEIDEVGGSRVMTYLALLFLAHRGRVTLEQDELFGDLWVTEVTVESKASEAIAD